MLLKQLAIRRVRFWQCHPNGSLGLCLQRREQVGLVMFFQYSMQLDPFVLRAEQRPPPAGRLKGLPLKQLGWQKRLQLGRRA